MRPQPSELAQGGIIEYSRALKFWLEHGIVPIYAFFLILALPQLRSSTRTLTSALWQRALANLYSSHRTRGGGFFPWSLNCLRPCVAPCFISALRCCRCPTPHSLPY